MCQSYSTLHAYLLLPFRTLPVVNTPHTLGISTQPIPPHYIPPHPILPKPTSHYSYTIILPYPTIMVEVNEQEKRNYYRNKAEMTQGRNDLGRNDTEPKWLSADHNLWAWSVFSFTIYEFHTVWWCSSFRRSTNKERQATEKISFERHCSLYFVSTEV